MTTMTNTAKMTAAELRSLHADLLAQRSAAQRRADHLAQHRAQRPADDGLAEALALVNPDAATVPEDAERAGLLVRIGAIDRAARDVQNRIAAADRAAGMQILAEAEPERRKLVAAAVDALEVLAGALAAVDRLNDDLARRGADLWGDFELARGLSAHELAGIAKRRRQELRDAELAEAAPTGRTVTARVLSRVLADGQQHEPGEVVALPEHLARLLAHRGQAEVTREPLTPRRTRAARANDAFEGEPGIVG